jgi:hypothetical protein
LTAVIVVFIDQSLSFPNIVPWSDRTNATARMTTGPLNDPGSAQTSMPISSTRAERWGRRTRQPTADPRQLRRCDISEEGESRQHMQHGVEPVATGRERAEQHDVARLRVGQHPAVRGVRECIETAAGNGQGRSESDRAARGTLVPGRRAAPVAPAAVGGSGGALLGAGGKLLDSPSIAIGIAEENEPTRHGVLDVSDVYAVVAQLRLRGLDVVDDDLESLCGAGWRRGDAVADDDRAARSGRRYLNEPQFIADAVVVVDVVPDPFVERLGLVDIADRYSDDFKPVIHFRAPWSRW